MKFFLLRSLLIIAVLVTGTRFSFAQVAIGATTPDAKAMLDIVSGDKGLLIPRMVQTSREGINPPTTGLLVYQTNGVTGFYYYDGSAWKRLITDVPAVPPTTFIGFSASQPVFYLTGSTQLTNWSINNPYYSAPEFNAVTGNYTVPATGTYSIQATINYKTTAAQTLSLGAGVSPYFAIRRTVPFQIDLSTGYIPTFNVNVALVLTLKTILESSTITLSNNVQLNAGDTIGLFYVPNGLILGINLTNTSWTITKIN